MPSSSRLPSSSSQPTGYCVWRRGSSASADGGAAARRGRSARAAAPATAGAAARCPRPRWPRRSRRPAAPGPTAARPAPAASPVAGSRSRGVAPNVNGVTSTAASRGRVGHARDQRALDRDDLVGAEPHVRAARAVAAQLRRGAVADHVDRVGRVLHAQRDPQVRVRPDVVVDDARGPLRREDQVHAERAAALRHVHQRGQQLGQLARHLGELVDHDDQARQRLVVLALVVGAQVVGADAAQQPLAVLQLGVERAQRPLDEILVEVGDHPDGVRQPRAGVERRAALEVHQQERELRAGRRWRRARRSGSAAARSCPSRSCRRRGACGPSRSRSSVKTPCSVTPTGAAGRSASRQRRLDRLRVDALELEQRQQPDAVGEPGADAAQLGVLEARQVARAAPRATRWRGRRAAAPARRAARRRRPGS